MCIFVLQMVTGGMIMATAKKHLPDHSSIRWDKDLQKLVSVWFEKNPGWTISQLANQAIRKFVVSTYETKPVEVSVLEPKVREKLLDKIISEHSDALDRLK